MVVDEQDRAVEQSSAEAGESVAVDHTHDVYTIANIVTILRLILVPIFFAALVTGKHNLGAFLLFTVAASTDWLDGQIARRTGTVTALGLSLIHI